MALRASDIVPISEARARLTELAEDVVGSGSEKVLTKNGASYVALVDARRLDYYHALEAEHRRREHPRQRKGSGSPELSGVPARCTSLHGGAGRRFCACALQEVAG
jgi:PHD/YefM family antitoxin component YafN of YafNO toxin-antitoxin module